MPRKQTSKLRFRALAQMADLRSAARTCAPRRKAITTDGRCGSAPRRDVMRAARERGCAAALRRVARRVSSDPQRIRPARVWCRQFSRSSAAPIASVRCCVSRGVRAVQRGGGQPGRAPGGGGTRRRVRLLCAPSVCVRVASPTPRLREHAVGARARRVTVTCVLRPGQMARGAASSWTRRGAVVRSGTHGRRAAERRAVRETCNTLAPITHIRVYRVRVCARRN